LTLGTIDPRKQWLLVDFRFLYVAKQNIKGKNGKFYTGLKSKSGASPFLSTAHPARIPDEVKAMLCHTVDNVLGRMYEARLQAEQQLVPTELLPRQNTFYKLYDTLRKFRKCGFPQPKLRLPLPPQNFSRYRINWRLCIGRPSSWKPRNGQAICGSGWQVIAKASS